MCSRIGNIPFLTTVTTKFSSFDNDDRQTVPAISAIAQTSKKDEIPHNIIFD